MDGDDKEEHGTGMTPGLIFLALFFFLLGSKRRREKSEEELSLGADEIPGRNAQYV